MVLHTLPHLLTGMVPLSRSEQLTSDIIFLAKLLSKSGIQSLRVYVSAQNPFILWSPLVRDGLGIDPEGNQEMVSTVGTQGGGATSVPRIVQYCRYGCSAYPPVYFWSKPKF